MFGHQDNQNDNNQPTDQPVDIPPPDTSLNDTSTATVVEPAGAPMPDLPVPTGHHNQVLPTALPTDSVDANGEAKDEPSDSGRELPPVTDDANDLLSIKQQALQQLSPLVNHLNQSPEEKFRTLMMMIQASDDQSLIKSAYEAAQTITDEKVQAQALLDIVNEINYFTHQHEA